jgi:hypothetical protein
MWNTSCTNKICFTKEKAYEQNLHLKRLFSIKPRINVTEPYIPSFLYSGGWQREKKRQEEDKVEKTNYIYFNKILETKMRHSKYSKYEVEPKQIYPAFRRYSKYKLDDIIKMLNIKKDNVRLENKLSEIKSTYERGEMRKEAEKQTKYLNNLLNRPKSIPYAPQLEFLSIDQVNNRLRNKIIKTQRYFRTQSSITDEKRRNSMRELRNKMNNSNIKGKKNKSFNKSNTSKKNQDSKDKKSLKITENNCVNGKKESINSSNKKTNKKETTTKCNTVINK